MHAVQLPPLPRHCGVRISAIRFANHPPDTRRWLLRVLAVLPLLAGRSWKGGGH
jgi:hypothetical protein